MANGIIYAVPRPPVPVPVPKWVKTRVTWTGHDGSIWDLTDPDGGVVLLRDGVEGLHLPKFKQWIRQSPAVPGQTFTGAIAEPRNVVLPLAVYNDENSLAWVEHDRAFWKSMHPRRAGILTISPAGTGSSRSIHLRLVPEDHTYDIDPAFARWAEYSTVLVADQPFWEGLPVRAVWGAAPAQEFYEETGPQLINIMTGHTTSGATLENAGDEDAWPVWTIVGPSSATHMGIGNDIVEIPFDIPEGKAVVLDTDPRIRTALEYDYIPATSETPEELLNPMDRTADLTGAVKFARIPGGATATVNVSLAGNGLIRVELTPLYWRAW